MWRYGSSRAKAVAQLYEYYLWEILAEEDKINWSFTNLRNKSNSNIDALLDWIEERIV